MHRLHFSFHNILVSRPRGQISVYNPAPNAQQDKKEAKKSKHEMAEYDEAFFERIIRMGYNDFMAYLHSLPEDEREAVEKALDLAAGQRAMNELHDWLEGRSPT